MDGPPPPEEDFSTLPLSERLNHKNWKARVNGYESLIKSFQSTASENDPAFRPFLSNPDSLKKMVADANAVAQEKAVETVVQFVRYAGENASGTRESVLPTVVDKCFGSTRSGTKSHALELTLLYTEVSNGGAGVVSDVLVGLNAKQPKTVIGTVTALKELVRCFGTNVIPPSGILKQLPKMFAHTDKNVRSESVLLSHHLYRNIGDALEPWLADLKPVQVKELHDSFEAMDKEGNGKGTFKPERLTRAQQQGDAEQEPEVQEVVVEDLDPRKFAEETNITGEIPSGFHAALSSSKWKERKEALDDLATVLGKTLRIKDSPELGGLCKDLAGRMGDANINCVIVAANCIETLAKGLGSNFAKHKDTVIKPMLERLKERKQLVADALGNSLDAVFATVTLADIIEDALSVLQTKNPQVKEGTLKFINRCLANSTTPPLANQIKPLSESLANLLEDSFEGARNEAAVGLGTLMKIVGERLLNPIMEPMAEVRKVKVKEAFENATVRCKSGKKAAPPAPTKPATAEKKSAKPSVAATAGDSPSEAVSTPKPRGPPARSLAKKGGPSAAEPPKAVAPAPVKKVPPPAATKGAKPPKPAGPSELDTFKYRHAPEEAEALAAELIPPQMVTDFGDANWKLRLAALEEMHEWLTEKVAEVESEVLFRFFSKRGWSEKNFQVSAKLYGILALLAEQCPSFGRSSVALATGHLADKLGDMKLKKPAGDLLLLFAEKTSLHFVLTQAYDVMEKQKAPKVLADSVTWVDSALRDFGIAGLSLRSLIEFLKVALKHSNAAVRSSGTKTLVTVKLFAGGGIKDFLEDLNPQLLATIQSEFDKVEGQPVPSPTRTSADLANASSMPTNGTVGGADPLDDLFPRVELDRLLAGTTILADAKSDAWKVRKEALETLQGLLDVGQNKRLKPGMGDIAQVLKARVTDTNKACQVLALDIVSRIASGMNKPFEKHVKHFSTAVASVLADQKANIRAAAVTTLSEMAMACEGIDPLVPGLASSLETPNPLLRSSLTAWLAQWLTEHPAKNRLDLSALVGHAVSCLDDRNADVRKGAQGLIPHVITSVGFDKVVAETNNLKPASRGAILPMLQNLKPSAFASEPRPPSPSVAPAVVTAGPAPDSKVSAVPGPPARTASRLNNIRGRKIAGPSTATTRLRSETQVEDVVTPLTKAPSASTVPHHAPSQSSDIPPCPFIGSNQEVKKTRLGKENNRWVIEGSPVRKELAEILHGQMDGRVSPHLLNLLFSSDHNAINDFVAGMGVIVDCYNNASTSSGRTVLGSTKAILLANDDLALKYACIKIHEPQSNLVGKCLDVIEAVVAFLKLCDHQLVDAEAACFIPTLIHKLGDGREPIRNRAQQLLQSLPRIYAYSRIFALLLEHGLKAKVSKTRQGALEELGSILKKAGVGACDPPKSFPVIGKMLSDKDPNVRKAALNVFSEAYPLLGEKIWLAIGNLPPKDKTQVEERLKRAPGARAQEELPDAQTNLRQKAITSTSNLRANSPSKLAGPRTASPIQHVARAASPHLSSLACPASGVSNVPQIAGKKTHMPSRLARPSSRQTFNREASDESEPQEKRAIRPPNTMASRSMEPADVPPEAGPSSNVRGRRGSPESNDVGLMISNILSNDPTRSVEALKKIQKVLEPGSGPGMPLSQAFQDIAEHSEGLIETITVQVSHVFDRVDELLDSANFRLAKHLMQTLHSFFTHTLLAESLTMDAIMTLLEELTLRLLQTDESADSNVKEISRFINLIILKIFATARRISVFRALFALLLKIVRPFPTSKIQPEAQEAKVAELVLKCIWKLARNIPADLDKECLDPVEVFPAIEHSLQSIPPNDWRARAANKVPCGDMPLRTIKVIIQHIVAKFGDRVYDILSNAFDDPSATIVYPYVYRILNSGRTAGGTGDQGMSQAAEAAEPSPRSSLEPPIHSRPVSEASSQVNGHRHSAGSPPTRNSLSSGANGHHSPLAIDDDPDAQLISIIHNISSETTGALHKEGITELHKFLKAYPHKKQKVDKLLEATGPAFRKYLARALASRAAEDEDRDAAVADTLSRLEAVRSSSVVNSPVQSPRLSSGTSGSMEATTANAEKLSRLHDIFHYRASDSSSREFRTSNELRNPDPRSRVDVEAGDP